MALERLIFHLTDRCQLACNHCLRDPGAGVRELEIELIESAMDQAQALFDTCHVGLTGGEPSLHPDFYRIVDAIVDRGLSWHLVTNGVRFDQVARRLAERPQRLESLQLINLSLEGAGEETNDAIRAPGSFRTVLKAVSVCSERNIPFLLQMTLGARNIAEIEPMALLAAQLGASRLGFSFAQPTGTDFDRSLHLPAMEWQRVMDRIDRVSAMFAMECSHSGTGFLKRPFHVCETWAHLNLNVDYQGRLNLCCQHTDVPGESPWGDVAGDLREMPLSEAHERFAEIVNQTIRARLGALRQPDLDLWDRHFSCNWCLKHHGKPYWTETGAGGPRASRARRRSGDGPDAGAPDAGVEPPRTTASPGARRQG